MKFVKSTLIAITILCILSLATSRTNSKSKSKNKSKSLLSRLINLNSASTSEGNGNVTSLTGQDVSCPTGSALNRFRLRRQPGSKYRYEFTCVSMPGIDTTQIQKYTAWNSHNGSGGSTNYLDRHHVLCDNGTVIQQFKLESSGSNIRYAFKCVKAITSSCYAKEGTWTQGGKGYSTVYLDRQNVECASQTTQALQGFRLFAKYSSGFFSSYNVEYRYGVNICTINEPTPVPLSQAKKEQMTIDYAERNSNTKRRRRF